MIEQELLKSHWSNRSTHGNTDSKAFYWLFRKGSCVLIMGIILGKLHGLR